MNITYPKPVEFGYTIYIKSGCPYCERIKLLLRNVNPQPKYIDCDPFLIFNKERFLNFIKYQTGGIEYRTFPIVFLNGFFIGGYSDTEKFLNDAIMYKQSI